MLLYDSARSARTLTALKSLGVAIAVDAFGTGKASFADLQRFPIDALKLQRARVEGIAFDLDKQRYAEGVIALGQALGLEHRRDRRRDFRRRRLPARERLRRRCRGRSPAQSLSAGECEALLARASLDLARWLPARAALFRAQRRWADARGVRYDAHGCVRDAGRQSSRSARRRGARGAAARLRAHARHLHAARAALLARLVRGARLNVFGYWRDRDRVAAARARSVSGTHGAAQLTFEEPLPTGLAGDAPTSRRGVRARPTAAASPSRASTASGSCARPRSQRVFKDKYFPKTRDGGVWAAAGLPRCQALAEDLHAGRERCNFLHAPQLLKHALGLVKSGRRNSTLVYLYYDWPVREAATHRSELDRVVARARSRGRPARR